MPPFAVVSTVSKVPRNILLYFILFPITPHAWHPSLIWEMYKIGEGNKTKEETKKQSDNR